ncbi:hypothetical protein ACOJAK_11935 [Corynebacterium striatum]|uniref:hypothetical protein n=1 Tax=Corynebacterium striatum TaxID=43770 RepID=UPI003B5A7C12
MIIEFATSDPKEAERRLRTAHPYYQDDFVDYVVQGVKDGIVRVRDPHMYGGDADIVPQLGKDEADRWEEWCKPLITMRDRDLARIPKPMHIGYKEIEYGARIGIKRDEDGNITDEGHIMWSGGAFARKFSIKTALGEDYDRKLYSREIINIQSVDVDESWLEED